MNLLEQINQDIKEAMKKKEKERLLVIRSIKAALLNEEKKQIGTELTEDDFLTVLNREMKQRTESLHEFQKANREDLVKKTEAEINILQDYMPTQLSDEELQQIIEETIQDIDASSKADMGKVMGAIMPKVKGKADGKKVNEYVMKSLT